ncbi:MAG: hypothetical protein BWK78_03020 [Thiotrichaceae bacterium IS1]|nr:MAG: hypothetical protein BWK78_03020 [Thiotrichaceae bacterium IS1]
MSVDSLAKQLSKLMATGALPLSILGQRNLKSLQPLIDAKVLEIVRSGGGQQIRILRPVALQEFVQARYPSGLPGIKDETLAPRARAVANRRDAKRARRTDAEPVMVRGFGEAKLFCKEETVLPIVELTQLAGVTAFLLTDEPPVWEFSGMIVTVENLECFLHIEHIIPEVELAIYAAGRLSERVLRWLGSPEISNCQVWHFGDYDPVGLDEYLRLNRIRPNYTELYIPPDLEMRIKRFGKRQLLEDNIAILSKLRREEDSAVRFVVELLDRYGMGLEQESLLIELISDSNEHRGR